MTETRQEEQQQQHSQVPLEVDVKQIDEQVQFKETQELLQSTPRNKIPAAQYVNQIKNQTKSENTALRQSVVVDLESDELTFHEAHAIRVNIEHDVQQLKNRVRMLCEEEQRALRQIHETRVKTERIRQIMS